MTEDLKRKCEEILKDHSKLLDKQAKLVVKKGALKFESREESDYKPSTRNEQKKTNKSDKSPKKITPPKAPTKLSAGPSAPMEPLIPKSNEPSAPP